MPKGVPKGVAMQDNLSLSASEVKNVLWVCLIISTKAALFKLDGFISV